MVSLRRMGALALGLFVITEIIMLIISSLSFVVLGEIVNFFYTYTGGIVPTLWFWLFFGIGLILLALGLFLGYMRMGFGYVPTFISAIMLGVIFSVTETVSILFPLIP